MWFAFFFPPALLLGCFSRAGVNGGLMRKEKQGVGAVSWGMKASLTIGCSILTDRAIAH